jgi:hypothetical protein
MKRQRLLCLLVVWGLTCSVLGMTQEKGNWRAASTTAKSITGEVAFSNEKIAINFSAYWIAQIRVLEPAEVSAAFDAESGAEGKGDLYRLSIPGSTRFLHKSTLCGSEDVHWAATYVVGHSLQLAFFSGSKMPVFTPDPLANATNLCGTFSYVK